MSKITAIDAIGKETMKAICYLSKYFHHDNVRSNLDTSTGYEKYSEAHRGPYNVCFVEDEEYVVKVDGAVERFIGFCHLSQGLTTLTDLNFRWSAAHNICSVDSRNKYPESITLLSKYVGDNKPEWDSINENSIRIIEDLLKIKDRTGFKDFSRYSNIREKDGIFYIFDTEKGSFDYDKYPIIPKYEGSMEGILSFPPLVECLGDNESIIWLINQYLG